MVTNVQTCDECMMYNVTIARIVCRNKLRAVEMPRICWMQGDACDYWVPVNTGP